VEQAEPLKGTKAMAIKVRSVDVLKNYKLALEFSDGTSGIADMSGHVDRAPFTALRPERAFKDAVVEHGAVEWPRANAGIATEALYALAHKLGRPTTLAQARANELTVSLRELRKALGKTQADVAEEADITQGALSHFEAEDDHKLSALRRYVEALGCKLEVAAVVGGRRFPLRGA
jgi:DNA-binding XRE family transcriptional regulator